MNVEIVKFFLEHHLIEDAILAVGLIKERDRTEAIRMILAKCVEDSQVCRARRVMRLLTGNLSHLELETSLNVYVKEGRTEDAREMMTLAYALTGYK